MLQFTTSSLNMQLRNIENERKRRDDLILHNYLVRSRSTMKSLDVINTSMVSAFEYDEKRLVNRWRRQIAKSTQFWTLCSQNGTQYNMLQRQSLEKALTNQLKQFDQRRQKKGVEKDQAIGGKDIFNKRSADLHCETPEDKIQKSQQILAVKEKRSAQSHKMNAKQNASELQSLSFWLNYLHEQEQAEQNQQQITKAQTKIIHILLSLQKLNLLHKIPVQHLQVANKLLQNRNRGKGTIGKKKILKNITNQSDAKARKIVKKVSIQQQDGSIWETRQANNKQITKVKANKLLSTFSQIQCQKDKNKKCESLKGIPNKQKSQAKLQSRQKESKMSQNSSQKRQPPKEQINPITIENSFLKKQDSKKENQRQERQTQSNSSKHSQAKKIKKSSSSILVSSNKRKENNQIESLFYKKDLLAQKDKKEANLNKKTYHSKNGAKQSSTEKIKRPSSSKNKEDGVTEKNKDKNRHVIHSQIEPTKS